MANGIVTLTTSTFDETIASATKPVIVDFWAEWCGPCKMIAPILSEIALEQSDSLTVAKLNVDENPDLAMRYNMMSIPTLLVFHEWRDRQAARRERKARASYFRSLANFSVQTPNRSQRGEAIRDLQRRLGAAGFLPHGVPKSASSVRPRSMR